MVPAQPPLPTAWNLPFHATAGSQTSILMSESEEGVSVAATRQKAGNWLNCCTAAGPVPGRLNPPAGTISAKVIEVFGSPRDDKLSHDAAPLSACPSIMSISARRTAHDPPVTVFIAPCSGSSDAKATVPNPSRKVLVLLPSNLYWSTRRAYSAAIP